MKRKTAEVIGWTVVGVFTTLGLILLRTVITEVHVALAYLLIVLGASARLGRNVGLVGSLIAFVSFNFFFIAPFYTLAIHHPLDWLVLGAFLLASSIAAQMLHRAQAETERAMHAESLREADQMKDALLASVSHDLRTPLTTIKALAHDLAANGDERAVIIEEESDRLNRFVSDMLDLTRLNAGAAGGQLTMELIAAEDVLGAALQRMSGAGRGRIEANLDDQDSLLVGRFDFVHTLRAIVNLIENALKYSPAEASIDVSARRDHDCVAFTVSDRGPGVLEEDLHRIFQPFVRGADSGTHVGVGLGLAIARQSIELQGGSLSYEPRDGGGSTFIVRVPAATRTELENMSL